MQGRDYSPTDGQLFARYPSLGWIKREQIATLADQVLHDAEEQGVWLDRDETIKLLTDIWYAEFEAQHCEYVEDYCS